jgi:putative membrane protein insertion efficiency factor
MRTILKKLIRLYQLTLSTMFPPSCRFYPTCTHYALEALDTHGAFKGSWLTVKRLCKCHPLHKGGVDLVPPCDHSHNPEHAHG